MPSKLLIATAEAAHAVGKAPAFGVHFEGGIRVNGREVMDRVADDHPVIEEGLRTALRALHAKLSARPRAKQAIVANAA
jgi:pyruvate/2-oxoglutarate dehydrogenase complex dihydrolipoamide dehydrogenase (E3) component